MISIRTMTSDDVSLGMRLKSAAGWNQVEADWRRHMKLEPAGCFVASCDGVAAATLAVTVFGGDGVGLGRTPPTAWIAMVLTDPDFRRRGLANALLNHAIDYCTARGVNQIRLDATAMGRPVYEKLGFAVTFDITRWRGAARAAAAAASEGGGSRIGLRAMTAQDLADGEVTDLDRLATGEDRRRLLASLYEDLPEAALIATADPRELTAVLGFALARRGSRALEIGPVVARTEAVGVGLLNDAIARSVGEEIIVDVPDGNDSATAIARSAGLVPERAFHRMVRRLTPSEAAPDQGNSALWVSAGPEFG